MLKYFSVTPQENSGGAENSTENSGPHAKNFFCSMYESSLRHPVWVPEINVKPCNSAVSLIPVVHRYLQKSPRIFEKFETFLMGYSGAGGKLIHEKTRGKKSRDTVPLTNSPVGTHT